MTVFLVFVFFLSSFLINCLSGALYDIVGFWGIIYLVKIPLFFFESYFIENYDLQLFDNASLLSYVLSYLYLLYVRSPFAVLMAHMLSGILLRALFIQNHN